MIKNKCLVCGGFNFRADRALSGRLICTSCGNPYGVKRLVRNDLYDVKNKNIKIKYIFLIFLFILVFILVII